MSARQAVALLSVDEKPVVRAEGRSEPAVDVAVVGVVVRVLLDEGHVPGVDVDVEGDLSVLVEPVQELSSPDDGVGLELRPMHYLQENSLQAGLAGVGGDLNQFLHQSIDRACQVLVHLGQADAVVVAGDESAAQFAGQVDESPHPVAPAGAHVGVGVTEQVEQVTDAGRGPGEDLQAELRDSPAGGLKELAFLLHHLAEDDRLQVVGKVLELAQPRLDQHLGPEFGLRVVVPGEPVVADECESGHNLRSQVGQSAGRGSII